MTATRPRFRPTASASSLRRRRRNGRAGRRQRRGAPALLSGEDSELHWSPDGSALAFVSTRTDHSFIGIYRNDATPIEFLEPSTSQDFMPRWSPDATEIAFVRLPGDGGPRRTHLIGNPIPWQIWVGDVQKATAREVWSSGNTSRDSLPQSGGGPLLEWIGARDLLFRSEQDNWPHLYAVAAPTGKARLLTPGDYMVEDVSVSPDRRSVVPPQTPGRLPATTIAVTFSASTSRTHRSVRLRAARAASLAQLR